MTTIARMITGGVDTHLDVHVAAALDERGALLGVESFGRPPEGYRALLPLARSLRDGRAHRHRRDRQLRGRTHPTPLGPRSAVVEVDRPNRQRRRRKGSPIPKTPSPPPGPPGRGRQRIGQDQGRKCRVHAGFAGGAPSARRSRTQAINQMRSLISTAPEALRAELRELSIYKVLERASAYRHNDKTDVAALTKLTFASGPPGPLPRRRGERDRPDPQEPRRRDSPRTRCRRSEWVPTWPRPSLWPPEITPNASRARPPSPNSAVCRHSTPRAERTNDIGSTVAGTARPTQPFGTSSSPGWSATRTLSTTSSAG